MSNEVTAAHLLTHDEARRIAANIGKLLSKPFRYDLNSGHFVALR